MTVKELYHALMDLMVADIKTADYEVATEGCDCFGNVSEVDGDSYQGVVIIRRNNEYDQPLIPTPEAKDAQEEKYAWRENEYNKYLENQLTPETKELLP